MPCAVSAVYFVLELAELRHRDRLALGDQVFHALLPAAEQFVPVLVIMPGAFLEFGEAFLDLRGVGDAVRGDVHAAVDDPVFDAEHGRKGEYASRHRAERRIGHLGADAVERRHRLRKMHRIVEPEDLVVLRAEAREVRVHVLGVFGAGQRPDFGRQGKGISAVRAHGALLGWRVSRAHEEKCNRLRARVHQARASHLCRVMRVLLRAGWEAGGPARAARFVRPVSGLAAGPRPTLPLHGWDAAPTNGARQTSLGGSR